MRTDKKGFTLAEVLITLSIIGVVAALTIPSIIKDYQFSQFHTQFKKIYSDLSQASLIIMSENGGTLRGLTSGAEADGNNIFRDHLIQHLKYIKTCDTGQYVNQGCTTSEYYHGVLRLNGETGTNPMVGTYILPISGSYLGVVYYPNCDNAAGSYGSATNLNCGFIMVDVNGIKGPNTLGLDIYAAIINENGLKPAYPLNPNYTCIRGSTDHYNCGRYCATKVMQNIDY